MCTLERRPRAARKLAVREASPELAAAGAYKLRMDRSHFQQQEEERRARAALLALKEQKAREEKEQEEKARPAMDCVQLEVLPGDGSSVHLSIHAAAAALATSAEPAAPAPTALKCPPGWMPCEDVPGAMVRLASVAEAAEPAPVEAEWVACDEVAGALVRVSPRHPSPELEGEIEGEVAEEGWAPCSDVPGEPRRRTFERTSVGRPTT